MTRRIGLLGGSFNPAHRGHRATSLAAMDALGLDEIWWLVSPGNPLKPKQGMAPYAARLRFARQVARRSRIKVKDFETQAGTVYTVDDAKSKPTEIHAEPDMQARGVVTISRPVSPDTTTLLITLKNAPFGKAQWPVSVSNGS